MIGCCLCFTKDRIPLETLELRKQGNGQGDGMVNQRSKKSACSSNP